MTTSEDDVDMDDVPASARTIDRDRRAPRFSWNSAYEKTFFRSLCESVHLGLRDHNSFHAQAWDRAAQALHETHGASTTKSHLLNKSDNARKRFRLWRGLRENPHFMYDPLTRTVTASEEAWSAHIESPPKREPLSRALRGRPFDHEEFMEILYPDVIGSGGAPKRITKPRRRLDGQTGDETDMPTMRLEATCSQPIESPSDGQAASSTQTTPTGSTPAHLHHHSPAIMSPPDESANQARKRAFAHPPTAASAAADDDAALPPRPARLLPEKRARKSLHVDATLSPSTTPPSMPDLSHSSCRWQETALELLFTDFCDQDMDLQIRISETVLRDEHRALVFCKMPWRLRQHWFRRIAETYEDPV